MSSVAARSAGSQASGSAALRSTPTARTDMCGCARRSAATASESSASGTAATTRDRPSRASAWHRDSPIPDEPPVTSAQDAPYLMRSDCGRCVMKVRSHGTKRVPRLSAATTAQTNGKYDAATAAPAGTQAGTSGSSATTTRATSTTDAHAEASVSATSVAAGCAEAPYHMVKVCDDFRNQTAT